MLERKCIKSYKFVQHCSGVTEFKQFENKASKHVLLKKFSFYVTSRAWQRKFVCSSVGTLFALRLWT